MSFLFILTVIWDCTLLTQNLNVFLNSISTSTVMSHFKLFMWNSTSRSQYISIELNPSLAPQFRLGIPYILIIHLRHLTTECLAMRVPYSELNTQNSNDDAGWIGFPSFGDTPALLHPNFIINQVKRTIRLTLVGSPHRLFFFSSCLIWFLNLFNFKPVSWYRTFFPILLITSTDLSDSYIEPFDSNVIGHFLLFVKLLLHYIPLTSSAHRPDFTAARESCKCRSRLSRFLNTILTMLDGVWSPPLKLSPTGLSSNLCSTKISPLSPRLSLLTIRRTKENEETSRWVDYSSWLTTLSSRGRRWLSFSYCVRLLIA